MATPKLGDRVWFVTKFGDRATGTFEGATLMPMLRGDEMVDVEVARVLSYDAFGEVSDAPTACLVPFDRLNLEIAP